MMPVSLQELAANIDAASETLNEELLHQLSQECDIQLESATGVSRPKLHYLKANCFAALGASKQDDDYAWSWNQDYATDELLTLRSAIVEPSFDELDLVEQFQIHTNLGNRLNSLGRCSEATEQWDKALQCLAKGAMAKGNKGHGLLHYGAALYDPGHTCIFLLESQKILREAVSPSAIWETGFHEQAAEQFSQSLTHVTTLLTENCVSDEFDPNCPALCGDKEQREYQQWCLNQRLFLNPLNDILSTSLAATDILHLPDHTYKTGEIPRFSVYFNQLKQEYVSARYRFYYSQHSAHSHGANAEVLLINNMDGASYGHVQDELKKAFQGAYSIFDKIAVFLNDYFSIGMNPRHVYFRTIWETGKKGEPKKLRPEFQDNQNWLLRGLYYLSKDFYENDFQKVASPEAKNLRDIRNQLEHSYIVLTESSEPDLSELSYIRYIQEGDFAEKTLRLLRMSRAALIYLSLAMQREEKLRDDGSKSSSPRATINSKPLDR